MKAKTTKKNKTTKNKSHHSLYYITQNKSCQAQRNCPAREQKLTGRTEMELEK